MLSGRHILIVEDEPAIRRAVAKLLSNEGANTVQVSSRAELEIAWRINEFDLVLLDLNLPDDDGLNILRRLRQNSDVPIIVLTGKCNEIDEVLGLELGANDYITKPFRPRSLLARIKGALRAPGDNDSANDENPMSRFEVRGWRFDIERRYLISPDGDRATLTTAEYRLLRALFERRSQVVSRKELSVAVFGRKHEEDSRNIDTIVSRLRLKFGSDEASKSIIQTVIGDGYILDLDLK